MELWKKGINVTLELKIWNSNKGFELYIKNKNEE